MRRQTPLAHQLYNHLFPRPTANDPPSFSAHLARNLVPEVRIEVARFYGDLSSTESRYPGLNYCHPPHRMRLGRFHYHRQLFQAFDELGLTYAEIQDFCCWEGTKWARERYEKDEGIKVMDTTGDEIGPFVDRREMGYADEVTRHGLITRKTEISVMVEDASGVSRHQPLLEEEDEDEDMSDVDSDGEGEEPAGVQTPRGLNSISSHRSYPSQPRRTQPLDHNILRAWQQGRSLPPDLEQYLKEESERGTLPPINTVPVVHSSTRRYTPSRGYVPLTASTSSSTPATRTGRAAA